MHEIHTHSLSAFARIRQLQESIEKILNALEEGIQYEAGTMSLIAPETLTGTLKSIDHIRQFQESIVEVLDELEEEIHEALNEFEQSEEEEE